MKLSKQEIKKVAEIYNLGKVKNAEIIPEGVVNYNFNLRTEKGEFIIRVLNHSRTPEKKQAEFKVLNYLNTHKFLYRTPVPIKNIFGEYLSSINGNNAWAYKKLKGEHTDHLSPSQIIQCANALAWYHKTIKNFKIKGYKPEKINELHWLLREYKKLRKIKPKNNFDRLILANIDLYEHLLQKLIKINFKENPIFAHSDFHKHNLLFHKNRLVAILDFDNLRYVPRMWDISYSLMKICHTKHDIDDKKKAIFLEEYQKINKLSAKELEMVIPIALMNNCIAFWWFYAGMQKNLSKRYPYTKWNIESTKNLLNRWRQAI